MDKEKFLKSGLLEQYVLGLTDEKESEEVERYAEAFPEIQAEIKALRKAVDDYARQYAVMPPEELKARVNKEDTEKMAADRREPEKADKRTASEEGSRWATWLARGTMALLIVLSLSFYQGKVAAGRKYQELSREYRAFQHDCSRQQAQLEELLDIYAFLNHEQTIPVRLESTGLAAGAEAIAYLNTIQKKVFINPTNLPAPPNGKTYQMWADVEGKMINMGLVDGHSKKLQPVAYIEGAESFNITLEPDGGSEAPTVTLLYVNSEV
ncbi:MAG: anti-sigma factor [Phaeodactylibacter sp.]|nr:anti-sigma factor [Phaeodactylibacter sp.]